LNCSSSDKSGRVRDRLNKAMTAHQMAGEAKAMDAMATVAPESGDCPYRASGYFGDVPDSRVERRPSSRAR
jgi:hypothetical protein